MQGKELREVPDRLAIWTYLSHEHHYKGTLASVSSVLSLEAGPTALPTAEILDVIAKGRFNDAEYGRAVLATVELFANRRWTERQVTSTELGAVETMLSNAGLPRRGAFVPGQAGMACALLAGWRDFLQLPNVSREATDHAAIVRKLLANESIGWIMLREEDHTAKVVVADGRHRLFAVLDVAESHGVRNVPILYGARRR